MPHWVAFLKNTNTHVFRTDYCRWGAPWRKRARFATLGLLASPVEMLCRGGHTHRWLHKSRGCADPSVAAAYPAPLAAALEGESLREWLAARGRQIDAHLDTEKGDTLLTWACRHDQAAVAQWLLEQGAEVDGTTALGGTALLIASQEKSVACVRLLLGASASVNFAELSA